MSIKKEKKSGRGIYLLPLVFAAPAAVIIFGATIYFWPTIQKLVSIMIKLVVKA